MHHNHMTSQTVITEKLFMVHLCTVFTNNELPCGAHFFSLGPKILVGVLKSIQKVKETYWFPPGLAAPNL